MSNPKVAVVILNWNGKHFLKKFLPNIISHSREHAKIIVADNASNDGSIRFLKNNFPEVDIIPMKKNTGYTGGYNTALRQIEADYYILLNSDIMVKPDWIKPVIELMESDKSIAACQPKILDYKNKKMFEYAGAGGGYIDALGYPFCRGRIISKLEKDKGQYDDIIEVFWVSGACMFLRADLFKKAGGFDDDFFAHMEEIDLCWRLKRMGYKIMYCGKSSVFHVGGGTLPKNNPMKTYFNFRNNLFLLSKNLSFPKLFIVLSVRAELDALASLVFLLKGSFNDFAAVIKAWFHFLRKYRKIRKKGKFIKERKVKHIYPRSILISYFLLRKKTFKALSQKAIK